MDVSFKGLKGNFWSLFLPFRENMDDRELVLRYCAMRDAQKHMESEEKEYMEVPCEVCGEGIEVNRTTYQFQSKVYKDDLYFCDDCSQVRRI